ncbi:MAG: phosphoribosyl-ATP diphosphatase [Gammaproteobacteria bacterium]|nr:MAG: phosphoribosyl-ATP diphosphatase [Gammaproteobacteria bacterium]
MNNPNDIDFLLELEAVIESRKNANTDDSYTAELFAGGPTRIAQKIGEEGVELALAAVQGQRDEIVGEAADLIYHLLVLLKSQDLSLVDVVNELRARHR